MKTQGEKASDHVGSLLKKIRQLEKQIQADRFVSIREKLEKNGKKLEIHVSQLQSATLGKNISSRDGSYIKTLSLRIENPIIKFYGLSPGSGEKDNVNSQEVVSSTSTRLPYIQKLAPYTTWIFLDKNQRMAEDQSVVGRRRIYYDQHGSEALICSDSEEDIAEPEEEKHEFSEGEDRMLWMVFEEHGMSEEVLNAMMPFVGGTTSEIQERYNTLKQKYQEKQNQHFEESGETGSERSILSEKSLGAALDSFDNLFCRRCLVFDCRLHGCSQSLINPTERQPCWPEIEEEVKPCSDQCYLKVKADGTALAEGLIVSAMHRMESITLEETDKSSNAEASSRNDSEELIPDELCPAESTKRKLSEQRNPCLDDFSSSSKKRKKLSACGDKPALDGSSAKSRDMEDVVPLRNKVVIISEHSICESTESSQKNNIQDETKDVTEVTEMMPSYPVGGPVEDSLQSDEWKSIEKELYLKGVEIFGRNSCLIARNLLCGLKTCIEVSSYMYGNGATIHRSFIPSSTLDDNGRADTDSMEQEMGTRTRLFRRRGRTRKLKYSWKSASHPSIWKRIADGKNQSCKQYTPCGCQFMCGKQCPCLHNGTCCEKYCGCSKSCKNRFRGCHCAKSQCRSRQCPCFAAGRECDPDVCRNCWVSCGDGTIGEPPKRGDGQCGNMRLLLRQQQRILLAKSDVAGWGAFIKNAVNKNDYLGEYTGELISHHEADKRGKIYDRANSSFLFDLNDQYVLDAYRKGDKLKFANHSSNPNCYAKVMLVAGDHRVGIFAKERIEASEELFYDYRYGPDQAPIWARKPEGSKREDSLISQGRAKKHQ